MNKIISIIIILIILNSTSFLFVQASDITPEEIAAFNKVQSQINLIQSKISQIQKTIADLFMAKGKMKIWNDNHYKVSFEGRIVAVSKEWHIIPKKDDQYRYSSWFNVENDEIVLMSKSDVNCGGKVRASGILNMAELINCDSAKAGEKCPRKDYQLFAEKWECIGTEIDETTNWISYKNDEYGYELKYPLKWEFIKKSEEKIVVIKEMGCFFTLSLSDSIEEDIKSCELAHGSSDCGKKEKTINKISFNGFTWADESDEYFFQRSNQQFSIRLFYPETEDFISEKYLSCKDELNKIISTFKFID